MLQATLKTRTKYSIVHVPVAIACDFIFVTLNLMYIKNIVINNTYMQDITMLITQ